MFEKNQECYEIKKNRIRKKNRNCKPKGCWEVDGKRLIEVIIFYLDYWLKQ